MAIIKVQKLYKKYGNFTAVNGTSFEVKEGQIFGILGPNGAGKTTTLEMIEGLRSISRGEILVDNINVSKKPVEVKQKIGVQLQSSDYFERLNLLELLELFASFYEHKINALNLLSEVGLEKKAKSFVKDLSGGQKQRFSIISTLVNTPKIIFLDEPTTGLDPQARHNIWKLIKQIHAKGKTVVLTTHYMDEAEYLCDKIAIMDNGKIIDLDTPNELIKKHGSGSIISFNCSCKIDINKLKKIKGVKDIKKEKYLYKIYTNEDIYILKEIIKFEEQNKITNLSIRNSNLEDVFLNLTGKKLRE